MGNGADGRRLIRSLAGIVLLVARPVLALTYEVTDLGTLGGTESTAHALDGRGEVVGESTVPSGQTHAFLFRDGAMVDLDTAGAYSVARDIDDSGQVVGEALFPDGDVRAFLYSGGILLDLGATPDRDSSQAMAINANGEIAGAVDVFFQAGALVASVYRDGAFHELPTLPGGYLSSVAFGINGSGAVVGGAAAPDFASHPFLFSGGVMIDLGLLPGDIEGVAFDVNDSGRVVGVSRSLSLERPFLFSAGTMRELGPLPGGAGGRARAINGRGVVVGDAGTAGGRVHAFIFDGATIRDLNDFLPPGAGVELYSATDVNETGQVVANAVFGTHSRAMLLTPLGCGDGARDAGETCDDGNFTSGDGCDANCTPTGCGNGIVTAGEDCDDGNRLDGDGCSATCRREPRCGDGVLDPGETCDGSSFALGAPAGRTCRAVGDPFGCTFCGDGIIQGTEECDDGNDVDADGCRDVCLLPRCGDGVLQAGEMCDDGNTKPGDDCEPDCTHPPLGVTHLSTTWISPRTGERVLEAEVWYPAVPDAAALPWDPVFGGARDATPGPERFPLIVFSHGLQVTESEYPGVIPVYGMTLRRLAMQGFVVAALDHPHDTFAAFGYNLTDRPLDVTVVLDALLGDGTPEVLRGHIDRDRVGVLGHSFGGHTAFAVASNGERHARDPRIKAVAGLAPAILVGSEAMMTVRAPALIVSGALDDITPAPVFHEGPYDALGAPKYFVQYTDGNHFVFSDGCESSFCRDRQTDRYLAAFFGEYLRDDRSVEPLLEPGGEALFENIRFRSDPGPALLPGGRAPSDCLLEMATQIRDSPSAAPSRQLVCADGAPCDGDPLVGRCAFAVQLCMNEVDRHFLACAPTDVASVRVSGAERSPELAALAAAAQTAVPTGDRVCSAPTPITVTIPVGRTTGRRIIRTVARDARGVRDRDRFVLVCDAETSLRSTSERSPVPPDWPMSAAPGQ